MDSQQPSPAFNTPSAASTPITPSMSTSSSQQPQQLQQIQHMHLMPTNQNSSSSSEPQAKKRKRVTRACDECRKKKVKCDGQQPCIHCTVYSYECTYDQPSNRKRIPDIRRVENKLKCAETIVSALLPGVDVYSPSFNLVNFLESIQKARVSKSDSPLHSSLVAITKLGLGNSNSAVGGVANEIDEENGFPRGSTLPSKFQKISRDGSGFPGNSSTSGHNGSNSITSSSNSDDVETNVLNTLYSPQSTYGSPDTHVGREIKIILPPKHVASELIEAVWDNACVLFRFYHRPSFIRDLDLLYETDPDDYTNKQYKILPLVYSVMAVGVLFSMDKSDKLGFKDASEGYKYFVAARKLIDIADARDTYAIQSIVMMIIFLQCSARLSTCYSYIGVALRSALRAGLHRKVAYNFNPIELETRKRLFWTIRKMDIYVNAMLGLPRSVAEEDFDQELPEEIDDENITEDGYFPQKEGKLSSAGIANAHTRLITILSHIMKYIYPVKQDTSETNASSTAPLYNVAHAKVAEMEAEIRQWLDSLPAELRPGASPSTEYVKANRLLHLALCHIQIVLYRPFIHYCSPKFKGDEKARASALNCIKVSRTTMHIAHDLVSKKLLNGAYWFSIYTIFFSVACLVYYVHENPRDPDAYDIRRDAELGKNALTSLKDSSMSAQRTYNLLNTLFEQLNRRTAKIPVAGTSGSTPTSISSGTTANTVSSSSNTAANSNNNNSIDFIAPEVSVPGPQALNSSAASTPASTSSTSSAPVSLTKPIDQQIEFGAAASGVTDIDSNANLVAISSGGSPGNTASSFYSNPAAAASAPSLMTMTTTSHSNNPPVHVRGKRGRPPNSARRGVKRNSNSKNSNNLSPHSTTSATNTPTPTHKTLPHSVGHTPQSQTASPINNSSLNHISSIQLPTSALNSAATPPDSVVSKVNPLFADVLGSTKPTSTVAGGSDSLFPDLPNFAFDPSTSVAAAAAAAVANLPSNGTANAVSSGGNGSAETGSSTGPSDTESPHLYVPGIMDQVDAQLFGRFLPPYMLQQTQSAPLGGSSGPHVGLGGLNGSTTTRINGSNNTTTANNNNGGNNNSSNNNGLLFGNTNTTDLDSFMGPGRIRMDSTESSSGLQMFNGSNTGGQNGDNNVNLSSSANGNLNNLSGANNNAQQQQLQSTGSSASGITDDRRLSLSTLFNKNWDEFLAQHNELSGLNSFMTQ